MDSELLAALNLVAEYDLTRPNNTKEFRLYYNEDGSIIGLWETDYPTGNYIVLDNLDLFVNTSTLLLRVVNGELKKADVSQSHQSHLVKSTHGQRVVRGHAALALTAEEEYTNTEYYGRKTNN